MNHQPERNFGLDLCRIIAMLMVCILHTNALTHVHAAEENGLTSTYYTGLFSQSICCIGVNLYAITTGYFCWNKKFRISRYLELWSLVAFYEILIFSIAIITNHFGYTNKLISFTSILKDSFTLLTGSQYWYFEAYTYLFLLTPFINKLISALQKKQHLILILLLCGILPICNLLHKEQLYQSGYNVTWLTCMYITGAYIYRFPPQVKSIMLYLAIAICLSAVPLCELCKLPKPYGYTLPNNVIYAMCVFICFSRLQISKSSLQHLITKVAPLTFGIYIIHQNGFVWS